MFRSFSVIFLSFLFVSCLSLKKKGGMVGDSRKSGDTKLENEFYSKMGGFKVRKPEKWHFATAQEYTYNLERIELDDKELQGDVLQHATLPLVAIMKYKEPYNDVNPSFKINIRPLGPMDPNHPVKIINLMLPVLKKMFSDLKVKSKKKVSVAGLKAGYAWFEYTMKSSGGKVFPISSEIWIIPKGRNFFLLGSGAKVGDKSARKEIQQIIKSVKFL